MDRNRPATSAPSRALTSLGAASGSIGLPERLALTIGRTFSSMRLSKRASQGRSWTPVSCDQAQISRWVIG